MTGRDCFSVVHALAPSSVGGLETVVRCLASEQDGRGHEVAVVVVTEPGVTLRSVDDLQQSGLRLHTLEIPPRAYHREVSEIAALLDRIEPDLVHTHGYRGDVLAGWTARFSGFPTCSTVHGFTGGDLKNRIFERLQSFSLRWSDAVVAVSRPLARSLRARGIDQARLQVIPNAWKPAEPFRSRKEARAILELPAEEFVAGWVGRLKREEGPKAPDVFIEALGLLSDVPVYGSVIGEGEATSALRRRAAHLGVGDRLRWHGEVVPAAPLFRAFDCFVLSSRSEGTPMVLLEAMAGKTPIVATRVGGVPDLLSESEATLVEPEAPAQLADAIRALYDDPERRRELARRAHRRFETEYGTSQWLDEYDDVYNRVLTAHRNG